MIVFGQRTFFSIIKLVFRGKREFYSFYYNAVLKDCALFKQTQSSIEIDVMLCLFKFRRKVCKSNLKKRKKAEYA